MRRSNTAALTLISMALASCGGSGSGTQPTTASPAAAPKTERLPADGGDVGKAYNELVAAYQAVDDAGAHRHTYVSDGTWSPITKKDADDALKDMALEHPSGGLRQADRATLFLEGGARRSAYSASLVNGAWQFDTSNISFWEPDPREPAPDCTHLSAFPCKAATFPDAQVSGVAVVHRDAPNNDAMPGSSVLLDGYGVRMFDPQTKTLKYTLLVLSDVAFEPNEFASATNMNFEQGTVLLEIAPDNKSAKVALVNANHPEDYPRADATKALTLDTSTPNRMRGHLKMDDKAMAQIDVTFDVATASDCAFHEYICGN